MHFEGFSFGSIQIDGKRHDYDVVIDGGRIRKRKKRPSKPLRGEYGHTPLSAAEEIPWGSHRLVIGTGAMGALPIDPQVTREAARRGVELIVLPTADAIALLEENAKDTNAVLHVTC
jgi:hypothetical protein